MTYLVNGRQFLVAVVNGTQGGGAELVGLAVGQPARSRWSRRARRTRWYEAQRRPEN